MVNKEEGLKYLDLILYDLSPRSPYEILIDMSIKHFL